MTIQSSFLALCAAKGCRVHGADAQNACAHAKACGIKTHMRADDAHIEWACEVLRKEIRKESVMEVLQSHQGHVLSGEQWMKTIDKILDDDLGFSTTTHDGCICKRTNSEGFILISRQVDDFLIRTTDKSITERIAKQISERVKLQHEKICQSHSLVLWKIMMVQT